VQGSSEVETSFAFGRVHPMSSLLEYLKSMPPVAAPHATMEDIVYKGYFIPKGAKFCPHESTIIFVDEGYASGQAHR
jgi:hypothetical protein